MLSAHKYAGKDGDSQYSLYNKINVTVTSGIDFTRLSLHIDQVVSTVHTTRKRVLVTVVTRKPKRTIVVVVNPQVTNVIYIWSTHS